jgi:hypothetical protein
LNGLPHWVLDDTPPETRTASKLQVMGLASAVLLALLRVVQGLAIGGEYGTAVVYAAEIAPPGWEGRHSTFIVAWCQGGLLVGEAMVMLGAQRTQGTHAALCTDTPVAAPQRLCDWDCLLSASHLLPFSTSPRKQSLRCAPLLNWTCLAGASPSFW